MIIHKEISQKGKLCVLSYGIKVYCVVSICVPDVDVAGYTMRWSRVRGHAVWLDTLFWPVWACNHHYTLLMQFYETVPVYILMCFEYIKLIPIDVKESVTCEAFNDPGSWFSYLFLAVVMILSYSVSLFFVI